MKNRFLAMICAAVLSVGAFSTPVQQLIGAAVTAEAAAAVEAPAVNLKGGSYYSKTGYYITLSSSVSGAKIYYSLNGSAFKLYTQKLAITKNTTLRAYTVANGVMSTVVSHTYRYFPKPVVSLASGTYNGAQTVKLSSPAPNVKFYYTLDGSTPTTSSKLYTSAGIKITESCKLRIYPYKAGWSKMVHTYSYVINNPATSSGTKLSSTSIIENYTAKYGYSTLTASQKKMYDLLYKGIDSRTASINVASVGGTSDDVLKAFYAVVYDNPQFFWLGSGCSWSRNSSGKVLSVSPIYCRTKSEISAIKPKIEAAAKTIVDEALKKTTLFERVKYIHDAIVDRTTYVKGDATHLRELDGVLVNGQAVCEGYSHAFAYLCQAAGINASCITGTGNGGAHMWNIINLDGQWYHMDVTFDDPTGGEPTCSYDYFCLTEKEILRDHTIGDKLKKPTATATKYNYYTYIGSPKYTNVNTAYSALVSKITANYKKGVKTTTIYCDTTVIASLNSKVKSSLSSSLRSGGINAGYSYGYNGSAYTVTLS